MGHVECPQSEPANNDLQPGRTWMVAATNCERVGDQSRNGTSVLLLAKPAISIAGSGEAADRKPAIFDHLVRSRLLILLAFYLVEWAVLMTSLLIQNLWGMLRAQ